jgi:Amt family ammonium transporter
MKFRLGYDDSLDVVGVHLVGGLIGSLALGFFADAAVNQGIEGNTGLFYDGGVSLLAEQALASGAVLVFSFVLTWIIAKVIDLTIGLRSDDEAETRGLDLSQHAEAGYNLADFT